MKHIYVVLLLILGCNLGFAVEKNDLLVPSATIAGTAVVCQNSTSPLVTFTGSGGTAPYTFTYTVTGTPGNQIIQTVGTSSSITLPAPTGTAGAFIYTLATVHDSVTTAEQSSPGIVTITVNAPPTVDFIFNNNSACSGTLIQFTSSVTGTGTYTYSWDFGDGSPISTSPNPSHAFTSLGCATFPFNVTLTVTGGGCTVTRNHTVIVNQKPDISFFDPNATGLSNQFNNCQQAAINPVYSIMVDNNSVSSCITSFTINWGDGNTQNNVTFPASHTYNLVGAYSMVITANGINGCANSKTYIIKNVSNPLGGLNSPGSTQNLCAPTSNLQFSISNWGANSLDTTYTINYGDATPTLVLTQTQLNSSSYYIPANPSTSTNYPIPHIYTTSNCPLNSYQVTLDVTNACGTTPFTLGNITIIKKPIANFTSPSIACITTNVLFTNTSIPGFDGGCDTSTRYTWNFGDPSGVNNTINTGFVTGTPNANHTFSNFGTYTVTLSAQNSCGTTNYTQQICIEPPLIPLFTLNTTNGCRPLAVTVTNNTDLTNQCATPTYLWHVTYVAAYCGTSITTILDQTTANASYTFTEPGTYTIKLTVTNSCGSFNTTQTVTVKKPPTASIAAISNFCGSASITPTASVTNCAPTGGTLTYAWSFPGGTPSSSSSLNPGTITYPAGGPYTISLVATNECGPSNTATQTFTVNTAPTITTSPLSQTICSGSSTTLVNLTANPTGTTFSWTAVATSGITGFIPSGTFNAIPAQVITTTNTSPGTVTYTITPTIGTCAGLPIAYVVNVNPAPSITLQPSPSTVCLGGTPTALSVTVSGAVGTPQYQWYSNIVASNSGGSLIAGATNSTYNPPSTNTGVLYYYCVIILPTGGCSSIISNFATVTINPLPTITAQPTLSQNVCIGVTISTPLSMTYTGGTGTATYQWYSNTSNATTGGTLIPGAISSSYTPPVFSTSGTYYYYAVVTLSGNGCGTTTSNSAQVNVFDDPTITAQPLTTQTLCQGATPTALQIAAIGGNGTFSYQWYSNTSNVNSGGVLISGATNSSFIPPTIAVGTLFYYCVISQTATPGCGVTSATGQVIINAAPTVQNQPSSSTICLGGTPTALSVTYINGVGTPSYQWYSNIVNVNTGGILISGATSATYNPPNSPVGTLYYYCVISLPSGGGCSNITSNTANVTINAGATINLQPTPTQSLCVGVTIPTPLSITYSGGTGTPSYQWYSNLTPSNSGGTIIPGATNATYTPLVFTSAGTYYYYAVVTLSGNGCGPIPSDIAEIIIVPDPLVTTQPLLSQTVCQTAIPTDLNVSISGGITAPYSYQWYSNIANNTTTGTAISGATTATFTPPTANVGTIYYYCTIIQNIGSGCNVTSNTGAVTVNLAPTFTSQPALSNICLGGTPLVLSVTYTNGVGTPSYQWYSNISNSNSGGVLISGATNSTYSPPNMPVGTLYYYCVISLPSTGGCSSITSNTADVTINPQATISSHPTTTQSLCVGATIPAPLSVSYAGGTGTATYQWYFNTNNSNTGGTLIPGATNSNFTPIVFTTTGTFYYYVLVTLSGNGCGPTASNTAEIVIIADPTITTQPIAAQTVCQNSTATILSVIASGGIGLTYNYQWYSSPVSTTTSGTLLVGETNSTFLPPTSIAGMLYYFCVVTQSTGLGCNVTSAVAAVDVNLAPAILNQPPSSTICLGTNPTTLSLIYINGAGTPNYQWYSNTTNSNSGGVLISGATSATFNPPATTAGTVYYYCEVTFPTIIGSCSLIITNTAEVTINQYPIIASETTVICSSTVFSITPSTPSGNIIPVGTTYTWSTPTVNPPGSITGASAETVPQSTISQTLVNTTTNPSMVTYTVTPISGSCPGNSFTVTVTVNPSINPNVVVTNNACFGVNTASITTNITGGIPFSSGNPYQLSWSGPNSYTSSASSISNLQPGIYNVVITDAGGCPFSNSYTITEPTDIVITVDSENDITCFSANNGSISISVNGGTGAYTYNWTQNTAPYAITEDVSNLSPGNYVVTVTDVNNCGPKTASFTITEPPLLVVNLVSQTNVLCYGAATGAIAIGVAGGTPIPTSLDYTYSWTGPNSFTTNTQNLSNLLAGIYNLAVTDNNGCVKNLVVTITQSTDIVISYTTTPITCYGANNASLNVVLSGGNAPYTFQWNNLSTSLTQTNLSAGNYIITVTDNVGCIKTATIVIPEAPVFMVNPIVTQITCYGAHNGSINLNLTGGIAPVALSWSDGSTAGLIRNNLAPGTYTATISDGTPCFIVRSFTIIEPQALVLSSNLTNAFNCTNAASGSIDLIVAGGTPPYTYSWSNGTMTEDLNNITSGNYLVTVTDGNGCNSTAQYSITRPDPILLNVTTQTTFDCAAHSVTQNFVAQASGGIPPYQFQWSSGTVSGVNNEIMHSGVNGTILLTATDSYGCTATQPVVVDTPQLGYSTFDQTSIGYTTYGLYAIGDPIQFTSNITGDYMSVSWDFGDGTFSTDLNPIHTYLIPKDYIVTQTLTYPFGCVYVQTISLLVEKGYILVVPTAFTPNNDNLNDTYRPVTKGLKNIVLDIYDTWGSLIYSEKGDVLVGWDARIKGFNAENGNYYSKVQAETFYGTIVNSNQTFVLIK